MVCFLTSGFSSSATLGSAIFALTDPNARARYCNTCASLNTYIKGLQQFIEKGRREEEEHRMEKDVRLEWGGGWGLCLPSCKYGRQNVIVYERRCNLEKKDNTVWLAQRVRGRKSKSPGTLTFSSPPDADRGCAVDGAIANGPLGPPPPLPLPPALPHAWPGGKRREKE